MRLYVTVIWQSIDSPYYLSFLPRQSGELISADWSTHAHREETDQRDSILRILNLLTHEPWRKHPPPAAEKKKRKEKIYLLPSREYTDLEEKKAHRIIELWRLQRLNPLKSTRCLFFEILKIWMLGSEP